MNFKLQQTKLDCVYLAQQKNMGITRSTRQLAIRDGSADIRTTLTHSHIHIILSYTHNIVYSFGFNVFRCGKFLSDTTAMAPSCGIFGYWIYKILAKIFVLN